MEVWKEIEGTNGTHSVSNYGRVKSNGYWVKTGGNGKRFVKSKVKIPQNHPEGYNIVLIRKELKSMLIHRLVAKAFIPNDENKAFVNHKDGIKTNNNVSNLEWVTRQENENHAFATGLKNSTGSANTQAKLNEDKVKFILDNQFKYSTKEFSVMFEIHIATINRIKQRVIWKHV